tara:strand:+ start:88 stop:939 length:852 start_codon:yes stop_codon:yes gene_type:complete
MGFFSSTIGAIGELFEEAAAGVGDVVESVADPILGPRGQRGERIGTAVGSYFGGPVGGEIGGSIGGALSEDISRAPDVYEQQQAAKRLANQDQIESVSDAPITEQDYRNLQRGRQIYTAGLPSTADEGTVIDIRYPIPKTAPGVVIGAGMDFIEEVGEFFFGDDNGAPMTGMQMCKPARAKAFSVNPNTGCISITRKQQAKLKELVRMVGIEQASKQIGLPVSMTSQLLLKTFRSRRKGISGADIRAVKRVDRQMHSLACALGGISQTSRAVASRKSPPKRSC